MNKYGSFLEGPVQNTKSSSYCVYKISFKKSYGNNLYCVANGKICICTGKIHFNVLRRVKANKLRFSRSRLKYETVTNIDYSVRQNEKKKKNYSILHLNTRYGMIDLQRFKLNGGNRHGVHARVSSINQHDRTNMITNIRTQTQLKSIRCRVPKYGPNRHEYDWRVRKRKTVLRSKTRSSLCDVFFSFSTRSPPSYSSDGQRSRGYFAPNECALIFLDRILRSILTS